LEQEGFYNEEEDMVGSGQRWEIGEGPYWLILSFCLGWFWWRVPKIYSRCHPRTKETHHSSSSYRQSSKLPHYTQKGH
jgi:hypothetical protein